MLFEHNFQVIISFLQESNKHQSINAWVIFLMKSIKSFKGFDVILSLLKECKIQTIGHQKGFRIRIIF
jgi:hypothetical protein